MVADPVPEACVATGTCVAVTDLHEFASRGREFLEANYIPVGPLRVVGQRLTPPASGATGVEFEVVIPTTYALVTDHGPARGLLDGSAYAGARLLTAGRHRWKGDPSRERVILLWARAVERGFAPLAVAGSP